MWKRIFPPFQWLKDYSVTSLKGDAVSGITLAAYGIPVSMAYATLAGLPVQCGIYGYLLGGVFYTIFGTSRQLAIGPTSAISLMVGTTIATMANGDTQRWIEIASLTALVMAVFSLMAYLLRLSSIINFISESVLIGFKAGAAITIALTQLPKLFGIQGGGSNFFDRSRILLSQLSDTNMAVFIFGSIAILLLVLGEKFMPGRPVAIVLVIVSIILISTTSLLSQGFSVAGQMPSGLPDFHLPSLHVRDVDGVIPLALACFLLAYIESVSAARTLAAQGGYEIDTRQELLAIAAANIATSLGQSYPVTGGLSQSAVNNKAGAKTPLSLVFASGTIALCLSFLTGPMKNLPNVMLASILLVAISGLVDIKGFRHLWKVSRTEFIVAVVALTGVIVFGILKGVVLAAISSILLLLRAVSDPYISVLGRIPGTSKYSDIQRHPENEIMPGIMIFRIESSIFYFNTENIRKKIWIEIFRSGKPVNCVILDLESSPYVDVAGAGFIKKLYLDLRSKGISLKLAETRARVRDMLRFEQVDTLIGPVARKITVDDVVRESV